MHGVVARVNIEPSREQEARKMLAEEVVPTAKSMPGLKGGYWLRALESPAGMAVMIFESEAAARAAMDRLQSEPPPEGGPTTIESVEVFEVAASA